jgi:NAD(P)-dependent dehydrogenase (short-subunit alcohol dehydrogenase family)
LDPSTLPFGCAASKATLHAFADGWLNALKDRNIRVNVLDQSMVSEGMFVRRSDPRWSPRVRRTGAADKRLASTLFCRRWTNRPDLNG